MRNKKGQLDIRQQIKIYYCSIGISCCKIYTSICKSNCATGAFFLDNVLSKIIGKEKYKLKAASHMWRYKI